MAELPRSAPSPLPPGQEPGPRTTSSAEEAWGASTTLRSVVGFVVAILVVAGAAAGAYVEWLRPMIVNARKTSFTLAWVDGQRARYGMVMTVTGVLVEGRHRTRIDEDLSATMSWQVESVDRNGVARVRVRLDGVSVVTNGKRAQGQPQTLLLRIAPDGRVLSGGDVGTAPNGSLEDGLPGMGQVVPILPDGRVGPGDSWTKTFEQSFPFTADALRVHSRSTLLRCESVGGTRTAVIATSIAAPIDLKVFLRRLARATGRSLGLPKGANPWVSYSGQADVRQTAWLDAVRSSVLRVRSAGRFALKIGIGGFPSSAQVPGSVAFTGTVTLALARA